MRRVAVLLMVILAAGSLVLVGGCGKKKPIAEPTAQSSETSALRGDDIPLPSSQQEQIYVEPTSGVFEDIHFDFDKYNVLGADEATLGRIARWLAENEKTSVLIEGHCDERGTNEYNMALGEQRALAARRYLVGLGVDASRLSTISYGEERPLDPRSNEEAWAKNRRAHFTISE
jgi:peptidoglycan-associated lipoprotein